MPKAQLSVPVALIIVAAGVALMYYVLRANGWSPARDVDLSRLFQRLSIMSRAAVVAGLVATAWGTGALLNGLVAARKPD